MMPTVTYHVVNLSEAGPIALEALNNAEAATGIPMKITTTTAAPIGAEYDVTLVIDPA